MIFTDQDMLARQGYFRSSEVDDEEDGTPKSFGSEDLYGNFNPNLNQHLLANKEKPDDVNRKSDLDNGGSVKQRSKIG